MEEGSEVGGSSTKSLMPARTSGLLSTGAVAPSSPPAGKRKDNMSSMSCVVAKTELPDAVPGGAAGVTKDDSAPGRVDDGRTDGSKRSASISEGTSARRGRSAPE